ncbi:MAG: DUF86 domain-containing protein [Patescibacteria group bacterium]|nr:DUF86 domain-containing protein [Patescibacteria group bacterium]
MKKDPLVFLRHILESIVWIEKDTAGFSEQEFRRNVPIQDAVLRRLEIIGEAVRNLPEDFKDKHSSISWQDISDMRNQLIHHYFGVDLHTVWRVVQDDLPPFKRQIEKILKEYPKERGLDRQRRKVVR